ncbi:MAG: LuxR C-terminal-related transcriptional regulator [Anaerolineae bacterium]|nr:LuxR C-terminal-related transcriptional regulator [Anaerolineae bacterium]
MPPRLLATKFHIPSRRAGLVMRPRLLEHLQCGLDENRKLTLISAPAGYGKTTLVAEWIANLQSKTSNLKLPISWLSLDEADNDSVRFFRYFLAAFQQIDSLLGVNSQSLLELPQLPQVNAILDDLLNDLAALDAPLVLVLDDYHVLTNPEIHAALEYFLDHQPAQVHLVFTTRADPPLPLARLRARGQMTELRARDLRFTTEEARQFFGLVNLTLAENTLRALDERTEGWAAGLQLAALALQHQPDPAAFIETFRGSHRYVLDYLAGEVIHQQDEEIRVFLTQTSPLDRFNAELCSALTGRDDSQAIITWLEQSNLFIIPLDDERRWYRYHHLFADYLRSLLSKSEQTYLCQKAAAWHEANDLTAEAVRYALACSDREFAAQVIENALGKNSTWSDGNLLQLVSWLEALPAEVFRSRPRLGLHAARAFYVQGRFDQAEAHLTQAEQILQAVPATPNTEQLLALATLNRGAIAAVRGEFQKVIALVPDAQARIPHENHLAHARAFFSLGLAYEIAGQTARAVENYLQSTAEARAADVLFLAVHGLCSAAQVQIQQGCLRLAENSCREAIQLTGGARIPPLGLAWDILGAIAVERNDLLSAEKYLQDGIVLSGQGGLRDDLIVGLASLGRLHAYQGNLAGMQAVMAEALSIIRSVDIPRSEQLAYAHIARYQHFLGQREAAAQWASEYQSRRAELPDEFEELTLARILLSSGELEPIAGILYPIFEKSTATGRMQTALEAMLLIGLYHRARGESAAALEWLKKSLELAAPEGYLRMFLDEGPALLELLPKIRQAAPGLVDVLLNGKPAEVESRSTPLDRLPDPLSEQEIRVLKLIVAGKSNAEIAAELVISVGTAKWHVHNILQKLGTKNRPQAIARARELGI